MSRGNLFPGLLQTSIVQVLFPAAAAELHPASIFGDHMVLQRDQTVPVWALPSRERR